MGGSHTFCKLLLGEIFKDVTLVVNKPISQHHNEYQKDNVRSSCNGLTKGAVRVRKFRSTVVGFLFSQLRRVVTPYTNTPLTKPLRGDRFPCEVEVG